jgi:hypothetical protein
MTELLRLGGVPASVATVNLAGEPLKRALAEKIHGELPGVRRLYNLYGPSEDTTYSTFVRVAAGAGREPSIGWPIAGTRAHVLDRRLQPLPVGVPGELCLGGDGLARGYLARPELTAQSFVPDPWGGPGDRLYRTGDLVRRLPDGELDFLGRIDHQIKLRGFRIELGEVEAVLAAHPEVCEAAALVREDRPGDRRLVAYVVPRTGAMAAIDAPSLRRYMQQRLPEPMLPAAFVSLQALPLTGNGKVDRQALGRIEPETRRAAGELVGPRTATEDLLAGIWAQALGLERVGVEESFFALGGHSLLATRCRCGLFSTRPPWPAWPHRSRSCGRRDGRRVWGRTPRRSCASTGGGGVGCCRSPSPSSASGSWINWTREALSTTSRQPWR